jgi:hypothetical protein
VPTYEDLITDLSELSSGTNKKRKLDELMNITREVGLNTSMIAKEKTETVGMKLMGKFGYKIPQEAKGLTGLGKHESGISEPLKVDLQPSLERVGIGHKKKIEEDTTRKLLEQENSKLKFLSSKALQARYSTDRKHLLKVLRVAYELDLKSDEFSLPETKVMHVYYENSLLGKSTTDKDEEIELLPGFPAIHSLSPEQELLLDSVVAHLATRLVEILQHLRDHHLYCYYCASHFDSPEQLQEQCPGVKEEQHED